MAQRIWIGTSGWSYAHWKGRFYPAQVPSSAWFAHYARHFDTVEINNTFYQQPSPAAYDQWRAQAPPGFVYAVKAHRFLTHMRKLKDPAEPLARVIEGARRLGQHLGPIVYQLPPKWKRNLERLEDFCKALPADILHVVEFRHRDWLTEPTYKLLDRYGVCLCIHDMLPRHPRRITGRAVYIRFHGAGTRYGGSYPPRRLRGWADWISTAAKQRDVFVYFNNDLNACAVRNAMSLRRMLGGGHERSPEIAGLDR